MTSRYVHMTSTKFLPHLFVNKCIVYISFIESWVKILKYDNIILNLILSKYLQNSDFHYQPVTSTETMTSFFFTLGIGNLYTYRVI